MLNVFFFFFCRGGWGLKNLNWVRIFVLQVEKLKPVQQAENPHADYNGAEFSKTGRMRVGFIILYFVLQLLDAFGHKSNISLVFDFMETDLEVRFFKTL